MAANLRAVVGRAAWRVVSEELLTLFRSPRSNPAVVAVAEAELMTKKSDVAAKKGSTSRYAKRSTHMRKKTYGSPNLVPWCLGILLTFTFLEGYEMGKGTDKNTAEGMAMNEH